MERFGYYYCQKKASWDKINFEIIIVFKYFKYRYNRRRQYRYQISEKGVVFIEKVDLSSLHLIKIERCSKGYS